MFLTLGTTPTVQRTMTFDRVRPGGVLRARSVHDFASGKSINVARVLHTLGESVRCLGFVGGERGRMIRRDLDTAGIEHAFIEVTPQTRLCVTVVDREQRRATEFIEEPADVTERDGAALLDTLLHMPGGCSALLLSGSLAGGVADDFYGRCLEAAPGVTSIVDGRGEPLLACLPQRPTVVKLNVEELGLTFRRGMESQSALRSAMVEVCALGARWCIVTRGSGGAAVTDGEAFWDVSSARVETVSGVGSGDAFAAGLAVRMAAGDDVPTACRTASACGAANAACPDAGHLDPTLVDQLIDEIRVRPAR
ncbi:MAG: hexose kinase [Planctomycetota bacterium]